MRAMMIQLQSIRTSKPKSLNNFIRFPNIFLPPSLYCLLKNTCFLKGFHLPVDREFERKSRDTSLQTLSEPQEKALLRESLLSKGYCVDTVSLNPETIRNYVQYQEAREREEEKKCLIVNSP
jgi:hypothetical protein